MASYLIVLRHDLRYFDRLEREHEREIPRRTLGCRSAGELPLVTERREPVDLLAGGDGQRHLRTERPHLVLSTNQEVRDPGIESVVAQLVSAVVRESGGQPAAEEVRANTSLEVEDVANLRGAALLFRLEVE